MPAILAALAVWTTLGLAGPPATSDAGEHVYMIRVGGCPLRDNSRTVVQTGFRVQGVKGIVTALHGLTGCSGQFIATHTGTDDEDLVDLRLVRFDRGHDLAVLSHAEVDGLPTREGLEPNSGGRVRANAKLAVVGHPHGISRRLQTSLSVRPIPMVNLRSLLPAATVLPLEKRESPNIDAEVVSIQGHLTVGHSGAPLLSDGKLVGVANGGLAKGAVEVSWGIPWPEVKLVAAPATGRPPKDLGATSHLFSAAHVTRRKPDIPCFGRALRHTRSAGLSELIETVDDPETYRALLHIFSLHDAAILLDVYRDDRTTVSLVVPSGWRVKASQADGCTAVSPKGKIPLKYEIKNHGGSIERTVANVENPRFCDKDYVVDPSATNLFPYTALQRGLRARRKSYVKADLRCGPSFLSPSAVGTRQWTDLPKPQIANCQAACVPPSVMFPGFWSFSGQIQLSKTWGFTKGVGFASYMMSETHMLAATLELESSWDKFTQCWEALERTERCLREYEKQLEWGTGTIAAVASTLTPH